MEISNRYRQFISFSATIILLSLAAGAAQAQSGTSPEDTTAMKKILTKVRRSDCQDYVANALCLIPRYHEEGKFDSVTEVIDFISKRCDARRFESYRLLRKIQTSGLAPDWCDSGIVREIISGEPDYKLAWNEITYTTCGDYDSFVAKYAFDLKRSLDTASVAYAIATYYAFGRGSSFGAFYVFGRDSVLDLLARGNYPGSCLQTRYDSVVDDMLEKRRSLANNRSINVGMWIPTGNLQTLGAKPEIGAQIGRRYRRFGGDITALFRFLDAKHEYLVEHNDSLYRTDNFLGIYLGGGPVLRAHSSWSTSFEIFSEAGWGGIMALAADDIKAKNADYMNSFNCNIGLTLRKYFGAFHTQYIGIQARYNIVDFDTNGGTNLSGDAVSINFIWGSMGHWWIDNELKDMRYFRNRH